MPTEAATALIFILSGFFFGAYTIGGPAAALYILSVQNDTLRVKSFLATFFSLQF